MIRLKVYKQLIKFTYSTGIMPTDELEEEGKGRSDERHSNN
jgi:hypothetical protein